MAKISIIIEVKGFRGPTQIPFLSKIAVGVQKTRQQHGTGAAFQPFHVPPPGQRLGEAALRVPGHHTVAELSDTLFIPAGVLARFFQQLAAPDALPDKPTQIAGIQPGLFPKGAVQMDADQTAGILPGRPAVQNPRSDLQILLPSRLQMPPQIHFRHGNILAAPADLIIAPFSENKGTVRIAQPVNAAGEKADIGNITSVFMLRDRLHEPVVQFLDFFRRKAAGQVRRVVRIQIVEQFPVAVQIAGLLFFGVCIADEGPGLPGFKVNKADHRISVHILPQKTLGILYIREIYPLVNTAVGFPY